MSREPVMLLPGAEISEAISVFNLNTISCIPVVNETGKPVGVVTWRDILKMLEPAEEEAD